MVQIVGSMILPSIRMVPVVQESELQEIEKNCFHFNSRLGPKKFVVS